MRPHLPANVQTQETHEVFRYQQISPLSVPGITNTPVCNMADRMDNNREVTQANRHEDLGCKVSNLCREWTGSLGYTGKTLRYLWHPMRFGLRSKCSLLEEVSK